MTIAFRASELDSAKDFEEALLAQPSAERLSGNMKGSVSLTVFPAFSLSRFRRPASGR